MPPLLKWADLKRRNRLADVVGAGVNVRPEQDSRHLQLFERKQELVHLFFFASILRGGGVKHRQEEGSFAPDDDGEPARPIWT